MAEQVDRAEQRRAAAQVAGGVKDVVGDPIVRVLPQLTHDHQARVQPHADGEFALRGRRAPRGVLAQALLQLQRRQDGPLGMILLGYGGAKHGREAFTPIGGEAARVALHHLLG